MSAGVGSSVPDESTALARLADAAGQALARWHVAGGGDPASARLLDRAGAVLWHAGRDGAISISLDSLAARVATAAQPLRAALVASPVVMAVAGDRAPAGRPRPLVLAHDRLYRWRDWQAESSLAQALLARFAWYDNGNGNGPPGLSARSGLNAEQLRALAVARMAPLLVLSGGPGTGKTHTLAAIVAAWQRARPEAHIVLAAPTGKAATRLAESLAASLSATGLIRTMTLHRLLAYRGDGQFGRGPSNPLADDLVVVDECSMVDARLAARLLGALGDHTRLILAGDSHQLASVEAGAFFGALCASENPAIVRSRVQLVENFRQQLAPNLLTWTAAIRDETPGADIPPTGPDLHWHQPLQRSEAAQWPAALVNQLIGDAVRGYASLIGSAGHSLDEEAALQLFHELGRFRVLSALRRGPAGADSLNRRIIAALRLVLADSNDDPNPLANNEWFVGRLVAIERNAPALGLFNGDLGLVVRAVTGPQVLFSMSDGPRLFWPAQLPATRDAFALTVHQSQGSEFEQVLLLPAPAGHPLATREALYTGATRARLRLDLYADKPALQAALATRAREQSGLLGQLMPAA